MPTATIADVTILLGGGLNDVQGKVDPKIGNAIGYLSSVLLRGLRTASWKRGSPRWSSGPPAGG